MKTKQLFLPLIIVLMSFRLSAQDVADTCISVRFLGTGAADWKGPDKRGEFRRLSSIVVDNAILVDFTASDKDMLPEGLHPEVIFYTHSHKDHYDPVSALEAGVRKVYVGSSWIERARTDFEKAAASLGKDVPVVIPLDLQQEVEESGITFKALPANHSTGDIQEQALIYLLEKNGTRVLYATDTGGLMSGATVGARIDGHKKDRKPLHGLIMEATMSSDEDFRIFAHSSIATVLRTYHVLLKTGCYAAPENQYVYLTHLARTLHGTQAELDATLPKPLKAAHDGLEVIFSR